MMDLARVTANRSPADTLTLQDRVFTLGHWYEYGPDRQPAQIVDLIGNRRSVKFRHQQRTGLHIRVCTAEEWIERIGDEMPAPAD